MFIPAYSPLKGSSLKVFQRAVNDMERLVVITGAGISTESGIPDYRSPKVGAYARSNHRPIEHQEFMKSQHARQRYWARNFLAWPRFREAHPNRNHFALASWERSDRFHWLITQNVDALHTKAGSERVTELHGCGNRIRCMECGDITQRNELQSRLAALNPEWGSESGTSPGEMAPDGDVHIQSGAEKTFQLADCEICGGILKTDVVFFGDNVPRNVVDFCYEKVESCDGVLVLGSSLSVMSSYRFVYHASLRGIPILIVNIGPTRGDHLATLKLETLCSDVITKI